MFLDQGVVLLFLHQRTLELSRCRGPYPAQTPFQSFQTVSLTRRLTLLQTVGTSGGSAPDLAGSAPTARWGHTMEGYDTVRKGEPVPVDTALRENCSRGLVGLKGWRPQQKFTVVPLITLPVNDLMLLELVIQEHYSFGGAKTRFYWVRLDLSGRNIPWIFTCLFSSSETALNQASTVVGLFWWT